ncbi:hypothetical protein CN175_34470, partial [Sinorhizobium meliloti]
MQSGRSRQSLWCDDQECRGNGLCSYTTEFRARSGTVRNSVRWAMMMKRRESSHGYRERTSGPAPGW